MCPNLLQTSPMIWTGGYDGNRRLRETGSASGRPAGRIPAKRGTVQAFARNDISAAMQTITRSESFLYQITNPKAINVIREFDGKSPSESYFLKALKAFIDRL
jgi:hypothetical protein